MISRLGIIFSQHQPDQTEYAMLSSLSLCALPSRFMVNILQWCHYTQHESSLCCSHNHIHSVWSASRALKHTFHLFCQTHSTWVVAPGVTCDDLICMYCPNRFPSGPLFSKIFLCSLTLASFSSNKFLMASLRQLCTLSCPFSYAQYTSSSSDSSVSYNAQVYPVDVCYRVFHSRLQVLWRKEGKGGSTFACHELFDFFPWKRRDPAQGLFTIAYCIGVIPEQGEITLDCQREQSNQAEVAIRKLKIQEKHFLKVISTRVLRNFLRDLVRLPHWTCLKGKFFLICRQARWEELHYLDGIKVMVANSHTSELH